MAWYDSFIDQGYTVPGAPRNIATPQGTMELDPGNDAGRFAQSMMKLKLQEEERAEKKQKEMQRKADMYKTLRESGYEPKRAYEAVQTEQFPEPTDTPSLKEQKDKLDIEETQEDIKRTKAQTESEIQKTAYYKSKTPMDVDEAAAQIERIKAQTEKLKRNPADDPVNQKKIEKLNAEIERINAKIKQDQAGTGGSNLSGIISGKESDDEWVRMIKPDKTRTKVHKDDVEKALKKGYKRIQ